jgi:hypothetical protein
MVRRGDCVTAIRKTKDGTGCDGAMRDFQKRKCYFTSGYMLLPPPLPPPPLLLQRMLPAERIGRGFSIAFVTLSWFY